MKKRKKTRHLIYIINILLVKIQDICIDELGKVFVYSPVNETVLTLYDELPTDFNRANQDNENQNIFIGINKANNSAYTFNLILNSLNGPYIRTLKELYYIDDLEEEEKMRKEKPISTTIKYGCYPFNSENGLLYYFNRRKKDINDQILDSNFSNLTFSNTVISVISFL